MAILDSVQHPSDLRKLSVGELEELSAEIRRFLIESVSQTGGHLGPNLGVVELTIALHRVFQSPADPIVFDTGHQAYVHKILTGRKDFSLLRQGGGLSGYPSRAESEHDVVENSHATTSLSWADGLARAMQLSGSQHKVVAVIGDGALTGGMAWEALNNIAEDPHRPIVIVLNDNGRSYSPTVGGFIRQFDAVRKLDGVRINPRYEELLDWGKRTLNGAGMPGKVAYDALHGLKRGMKDVLFDAGIFDSLGLKYLGPVNGHEVSQLLEAFEMARQFNGPVVVHAITEKGRGYKPAEQNREDHFHAVGVIHPETGLPLVPSRFGWTSVFADEMLQLASADPKLVGITAAMMMPVGFGPMHDAYPDRVIDTGIAEQHAMTMAAGLAHGGYHPVVALYATFMNRAFDQLLMDVALHGEAVTICLDRAGITGDDGASHNGMWDLSIAAMVPGLHVAVPRDEKRMRQLVREAVQAQVPTLVRYPKGAVAPELAPVRRHGGVDVLYERVSPSSATSDSGASGEDGKGCCPPRRRGPILLVGLGPLAHTMVEAAQQLTGEDEVVVADPKWVLPISGDLVDLASQARAVVVLEDGLVEGGVGAALETALETAGIGIPVRKLGVHKHFLAHNTRNEIMIREAMSVEGVLAAVAELNA